MRTVALILSVLLIPAAAQAAAPAVSLLSIHVTKQDYRPVVFASLDDCQPLAFDPTRTPYRIVSTGGRPAKLYMVEGAPEGAYMMIDGWSKEGAAKTYLNAPFDLTAYNFGCASTFSWVLQITKAGRPYALYTHINRWSISGDKQQVAIENEVKRSDGSWQKLRRIITIATKRTAALPTLPCVEELASFTKHRLVTYSRVPDDYHGWDGRRPVCVWDTAARLVGSALAHLREPTGEGDGSNEQIGILPNEPSTLYNLAEAPGDTQGGASCILYLQDLHDQSRYRTIQLLSEPDQHVYIGCDSLHTDLDLSHLALTSGAVKFRVRSDKAWPTWSPWQAAG